MNASKLKVKCASKQMDQAISGLLVLPIKDMELVAIQLTQLMLIVNQRETTFVVNQF